MTICAVPMCATTHRTTDKTLYRFPKDIHYARIWVRCCMKKDSFNTRSAFICSQHFADEAYQRDINHDVLGFSSKKSLRKDAVPTLQLPSIRMFRKSIIETHKSEDISLLVDVIPAISPKIFMKQNKQFDFFSCPRKNKSRSKFSRSFDQSMDTSFNLSTENVEYISEENEKLKTLPKVESENREELD